MDIFLKANPHIETVYFNEKGEWSFSPNPKYPIEKSREEILEAYEAKAAYDAEMEDARLKMESDLEELGAAKTLELKAKVSKGKGKTEPVAPAEEIKLPEPPTDLPPIEDPELEPELKD